MWQALDLKPWTHSGQSNKTVHGFNIIIFFLYSQQQRGEMELNTTRHGFNIIDPKGYNIYTAQ